MNFLKLFIIIWQSKYSFVQKSWKAGQGILNLFSVRSMTATVLFSKYLANTCQIILQIVYRIPITKILFEVLQILVNTVSFFRHRTILLHWHEIYFPLLLFLFLLLLLIMMIMIVGGIHDDGSGAVRGWKNETGAKIGPKKMTQKSRKLHFLFVCWWWLWCPSERRGRMMDLWRRECPVLATVPLCNSNNDEILEEDKDH